ncbi:MAG: nucleotide exchange factor GrpE [Candidatus Delongbacteria bacterium]|nr:nucleotide exchange factor GrpE [Candidatus Delongbacteria bacterium]
MKKMEPQPEQNPAPVEETRNEPGLESEMNQAEAPPRSSSGQEAEPKIQDYIIHLQRLQAEFDNYRKRVNKEKESWEKQSVGDFIKKLLPILSDMERAFSQLPEPQSEVEKGLKLIFIKFREILQKEGLSEIKTLGEPFDPHLHDAIMIQPVEEGEDNRVINEYEKGYLFHDTVLRHARVVVSLRQPASPSKSIPSDSSPDETAKSASPSFDQMA